MGKISDNGGVYMTIITSDMWYDHIHENKSIVTYDTNLNLYALFARIRPDQIRHSEVDVKNHNVLLECWMEN